MKVGLFVGRFQPITKAHTDIINEMSKNNDKCIIFLVKSKSHNISNPFNESIQKEMLESIIPENVSVEVINTGFFVDYINTLDESDFTLYAGTDRVQSYESFKKYMNEGKTLNIVEISRTDDDISASLVRESIINDDVTSFKNMTDDRIHKFYDTLKKIMSEETVSGDIAPFTKPINTKVEKRPSFKEFVNKKKTDKTIKNEDE